MPAATVSVGPVTVTYVHEDPAGSYALLEWLAPPGAASPPLHVHHRTDEGFYVLSGEYRFLVDGETIDGSAGAHVLVRSGSAHTFWNAGDVPARCLIILTPPDFAPSSNAQNVLRSGSNAELPCASRCESSICFASLKASFT